MTRVMHSVGQLPGGTLKAYRLRARGRVVLLVATILLTACSAPVPGPTQVEPEPSPSQVDWLQAWRDWKPQATVTPVTFTDEEAESIRQEWLREEMPDILPTDTPVPEMVRWDPDDSGFIACVTEAGFKASAYSPAGDIVLEEVTDSQRSQLQEVMWRCRAQYPPPPSQMLPWTQEQNAVQYEYLTDFYVPCVTAQGFRWSGPPQPSEEQWIADLDSAKVTSWNPLDTQFWSPDGTRSTTPPISEDLYRVCPHKPPASALYG